MSGLRRLLLLIWLVLTAFPAHSQDLAKHPHTNPELWRTDLSKSKIDVLEIVKAGPEKDGIPALNQPTFETFQSAQAWLSPHEPVIALQIDDTARAYPLQILMWHEIVNDTVANLPVLVTFCPLCHSAVVFDRRLKGEVLDFGVSGLLRRSDMIMFDRKTETLWQQFNGEALVGTYSGEWLDTFASQLLSFEQFQSAYPKGLVLSQQTGYDRAYGANPYPQYDRKNRQPMLFKDKIDKRLAPMERVVSFAIDEKVRGYPLSVVRKRGVIQEQIGERAVVIFHAGETRSALSNKRIRRGRKIGSVGVFNPVIKGETYHFVQRGDAIYDRETQSQWNIVGQATAGPLAGKQLETIKHRVDFAFAWFAFNAEAAQLWQDD